MLLFSVRGGWGLAPSRRKFCFLSWFYVPGHSRVFVHIRAFPPRHSRVRLRGNDVVGGARNDVMLSAGGDEAGSAGNSFVCSL